MAAVTVTTSSKAFSLSSAAPRFATPATPGRENLAAAIGKTAAILGFETTLGPGLMPWQHSINSTATELDEHGRFVYRQVVIEVMRQQGKTVDLLSMMIARALRRRGTMISYTAQNRLEARKRLLDVWWPRIQQSKLYPRYVDVRRRSARAIIIDSRSTVFPCCRITSSTTCR